MPGEPRPDSAKHLPLEALEQRVARLAVPPADVGRVRGIVCRLSDRGRKTPPRAELTVADGLVGDDWSQRPPRDPEAQTALPHLRETHLRGVHWRVVEPGAVAVGDAIEILSRGAD